MEIVIYASIGAAAGLVVLGIAKLIRGDTTPPLIKYMGLLHKYKTLDHPKLVRMREAGDDDFKRRVAQLDELWEATLELRQ